MPKALQCSMTGWFRLVCALVLLICLVINHASAGEATSQNFRLIGQTSLMAAGSAQSTGFGLQSCIDASPSGISTSSSFKLDSGCMSTILAATETNPARPATTSSQAVPLFDVWQIALLMFVLALLAWRSQGDRRIG